MKFGFAFALYSGTLAWLLTKLRKGGRLGWWVGTVFALAAIVEVATITVQAARGTISHFNANQNDPVTLALVPVLTYGVMIILIAQLIIAVVVLIQRTGGAALNRAIRAGLGLATFGMLVPIYWMVAEINPRTVTDANGEPVQMYQGHGIGDPDGNGMPLTGWSVSGGDFRVPHFFALHGNPGAPPARRRPGRPRRQARLAARGEGPRPPGRRRGPRLHRAGRDRDLAGRAWAVPHPPGHGDPDHRRRGAAGHGGGHRMGDRHRPTRRRRTAPGRAVPPLDHLKPPDLLTSTQWRHQHDQAPLPAPRRGDGGGDRHDGPRGLRCPRPRPSRGATRS
ncbi:hypothetical protein [Nonomuraea dietziae]|uniref:hypothetical protein n=1 Tax=Nonomuraea dietziae TaxID=65515 RepID=UPI0031DC0EC2